VKGCVGVGGGWVLVVVCREAVAEVRGWWMTNMQSLPPTATTYAPPQADEEIKAEAEARAKAAAEAAAAKLKKATSKKKKGGGKKKGKGKKKAASAHDEL